MAEIDLTYVVAPSVIAVTTVIYSYLRLKKEERKVKASEAAAASSNASFQAMTVYHAKRLDIEEEKLELARGNTSAKGVLVREHSRVRPSPRPMPEAIDEEPTVLLGGTMVKNIAEGAGKPAMMSDEEFAARIRKIREMGQ